LELRRNNVSLAGAQALARTLTLNPSLTTLALKPNPCHYDLRANKVNWLLYSVFIRDPDAFIYLLISLA